MCANIYDSITSFRFYEVNKSDCQITIKWWFETKRDDRGRRSFSFLSRCLSIPIPLPTESSSRFGFAQLIIPWWCCIGMIEFLKCRYNFELWLFHPLKIIFKHDGIISIIPPSSKIIFKHDGIILIIPPSSKVNISSLF